ncbi:MAG: hypothetical protein AB8F94_07440 [Saprospiraceae bacterium]
MQQVSTSLTLFLKIFVPLFWTVIFSSFTMAVWFLDMSHFAGIPIQTFRYGITIFLIVGIAFFYFTVLQLKRVEMDQTHIFATNYFKNYKYPWSNVENIEERDFVIFRTIHIILKEPGNFGKKITFVASRRKFNSFIKENPHLFEQFA